MQMQDTTPSGYAYHPSTGGELLSANARHHPVKLRLPPLHRRGIAQCRCKTPPRQATPATPPQEGNCLVQMQDTTPSSFACHSSTGGELLSADARHHPVRLRLPPPHRRGIAQCRCKTLPRQATPPGTDAMQSPQCICTRHLPSTGGELLNADARHHPVRLRHQVQMRCNRPSVSVLDISPPQERNSPLLPFS